MRNEHQLHPWRYWYSTWLTSIHMKLFFAYLECEFQRYFCTMDEWSPAPLGYKYPFSSGAVKVSSKYSNNTLSQIHQMCMYVDVMCLCLWDRQIQVQRISIPVHISPETGLTGNSPGASLEIYWKILSFTICECLKLSKFLSFLYSNANLRTRPNFTSVTVGFTPQYVVNQ